MKLFAAKFILALFLPHQGTAVAPINSTPAATGCDNATIQCTYTDVGVKPGAHFYFVVASNAAGYSGPSNRIDVTVPAGTHNVVLKWSPSATGDKPISYFVYRGQPASNLHVISVQ